MFFYMFLWIICRCGMCSYNLARISRKVVLYILRWPLPGLRCRHIRLRVRAHGVLRALFSCARCRLSVCLSSFGVAVNGQSGDVEHATSYAFIRLAFTPDAEGERVTYEFVGVESSNAVAESNARQVDKVN